MTKLFNLASAFYDSVWDFSTKICLLPDTFKEDGLEEIAPDKMLSDFQLAAFPFLDLSGEEIPELLHANFDQIDETIRGEVLPSYDVLIEEWQSLKDRTDQLTREEMLVFGEKCAYLVNQIEMYVIAQTHSFIKDLERLQQPA